MGNAAKSPYGLASEAAARLGIALAASELATLASGHDMLMFTKNWSSWSRFSEHRGHE